jgi:hypothetical protein
MGAPVTLTDPQGKYVGGFGTGTSSLSVRAAPYSQLGYQQLTSLPTSTALTIPNGASTAIVQNNGNQPVRWRPDGATTAPTATTGQRIAAGDRLTLDIGAAGLASSRFIQEASGAVLDVTYYS